MSFKVKAWYLISFVCFTINAVAGQDQQWVDSLITQYKSGTYQEDELVILNNIAKYEIDPEIKLEFSDLLIKKASPDSLFSFLHSGYLQQGNAFLDKGNNALALESFIKSLNYAHRSGDEVGIGALNISIADAYSNIGNSNNAEIYYNKGIELIRKINDSLRLATALLNAGDEYFKNKKYDSATQYYDESGLIFKNINHLKGTGYYLGNMGMVYADQGKDVLAKANLNEAITILEGLEQYLPISAYLIYLSNISLKQNDFPAALSYAQRSLELAELYDLKKEISDANLKLAELYDHAGNQVESNKFYRNHIVYRDSINNIEAVQRMADLRTNYEVSQMQIEVDLLNQQKRSQKIIFIAMIIIAGLTIVLLLTLYWYYRAISREKKISENLLLNILPFETAEELKKYGKVKAKRFDSVTVLFTDFKAFSTYAGKLSPEKLVETVDYYFSKFDEVFGKHGLEKIKTIGDAYMCVGGLHYHKEDHALKMVLAALEINEFVCDSKKLSSKNETRFDMRIGINTGAVVAGVVGTEKFAYDIWGDTVNVASRMQSNSVPGKINISENTYDLIKDIFDCEYRGEFEVKNKGMMKMYYVNNIKDKTK